jgi:hypothetical protein
MDVFAELYALKATRDALEEELRVPNLSKEAKVAIRLQLAAISMELGLLHDKTPAPRSFFGVEIAPGMRGTIDFYGKVFGVPMGMYYCHRFCGTAFFKWRHARRPYSDDKVLHLCRRYDLPSAEYKAVQVPTTAWQADAVKGALSGAGTLALLMYNRVFRRGSSSIGVVDA